MRTPILCALLCSIAGCSGEHDNKNPGPDAGGGAGYEPRLDPVPCRFALHPQQIQGQTVRCFDLIVPENRAYPERRTIALHVARYTGGKPSGTPVIWLNGGPGGPSDEFTYFFLEPAISAKIAAQGDLLVFDQRGANRSVPALGCEASDGSFEACRDRLAAANDLAAYNTLENAADVDDLRAAVGAAKMRLWGISYGSRLGLEVMRQFPAHVERAVIDGLVPAHMGWFFDAPLAMESSFSGLRAYCDANPACASGYGNLDRLLDQAYARANEAPIMTDLGFPLDGATLVQLVFESSYSAAAYPMIPRLLKAVRDGNVADVNTILSPPAGAPPLPPELATIPDSSGMYASILCNDLGQFWSQSIAPDRVRRVLLETLHPSTIDVPQMCAQWPTDRTLGAALSRVISDVPALVMNGELDPITPPAYGREAAATLSNHHFVTFPATGHGQLHPCALEVVLKYLADGSAPTAACIGASPKTIDFVGPTEPLNAGFQPRKREYVVPPLVRKLR